MAIRIRSIHKIIEDTGIKMLVHGPSGAGKTVLCCTTGEPTLIISAESGLLSLKKPAAKAKHMIKAVEIGSVSELDEVYEWLIDPSNKGVFKWVCLDSITEIAERILSNEKREAKDPRKAYMEVQDQMMVLLRKFRDLKDYNVLMSAKQQVVVGPNDIPFFAPMMPGTKLHQQIPYIFDEVFALRVEVDEEKKEYRVIQTGRDVQFEAKDRSGELEMFESPNIARISKKIRGGDKTPESTKKALDKMKEKIIADVKEAQPESEDDQEEIIIDDLDASDDETNQATEKEGE